MQSSTLLGHSPLRLTNRTFTDRGFAVGFIVHGTLAALLAFVAASKAHYKEFFNPPPASFSCAPAYASHRLLLEISTTVAASTSSTSMVATHLPMLLLVLPIVGLVGAAMIHAIRTCAPLFVYSSMAYIPASFLLSGFAMISASPGLAVLLFLLAGVWCLIIFCWRDGLRLTAALLEQAATVLTTYPGILVAGGALVGCYLLVLALGVGGLLALVANGQWVAIDDQRYGSCEWQPNALGTTGIWLLAMWLLWAFLLVQSIQTFIASLVTALWYFDARQSDEALADAPGAALARREPVRMATTLAFTKSLGTLCFSSAVIVVCTVLRFLARQAQRRSGDHFLVALAAACLRCLLDLVETLTKFATCMHSITGDSFCGSARHISDLLTRHGLNSWFVDHLSLFVLHMTSLAFSGLAAGSTYLFLSATLSEPQSREGRRAVAGAFASMTFVFAWLLLTYCTSFINAVVDAAYTCLAIDMEGGAPHQPDLRDVMIPIVKPEYTPQPHLSDSVIVVARGDGSSKGMSSSEMGNPVAGTQPMPPAMDGVRYVGSTAMRESMTSQASDYAEHEDPPMTSVFPK